MKEDISKQLRALAITKQLNFLLGSGVSVPAIPLMGTFKDSEGVSANEKLLEYVKKISNELTVENKNDESSVSHVLKNYQNFLESIISVMNLSNSRQVSKNVNIFTTNYDLFLEKSMDLMLKKHKLVFNDGASGYFNRYLESSNYNRMVSYKGLNNNYINEIPSITLIKPHGSVNWEKQDEHILIKNTVVSNPVVVHPDGYESSATFYNNHFHEMLRIFQMELDKPQSVLIVIGFSFQDKHIAKMIRRAVQNPELMVYAFGYSDDDKMTYLKNLNFENERYNFKVLTPENLFEKDVTGTESKRNNFTLSDLTNILANINLEGQNDRT
ncbi:SIR2 family protein [Exiguobacterium sp. s189]|uniref:SIR2 family protein n=1 Tax=Exiguobacterium sp. s189 TaxID=2751263 RepID=UPI001BECF3C4|nr:SIR2 family protein [Exiguobacterium sp. s189]